MRKIEEITIPVLVVLFLQLTFQAKAQCQAQSCGLDSAYYLNPVFAGDYPDPSIMRDGDTYYMVHSSFDYYPGTKARELRRYAPQVSGYKFSLRIGLCSIGNG